MPANNDAALPLLAGDTTVAATQSLHCNNHLDRIYNALNSRQFWYGVVLSNYLATSRLMAAAVSAFSMFLATEALFTSIAAVAAGDSVYTAEGTAKTAMDALTGVLCALTFTGMASGAYYAQSFRLQATIIDLIKGKSPFVKANAWLIASNVFYGALIAFQTLASIMGLAAWISTSDTAYVTSIALGIFFGFGYGLLSINYNLQNIKKLSEAREQYHKKVQAITAYQNAGTPQKAYLAKLQHERDLLREKIHASGCEWLWFAIGNMLSQCALNTYLPSQGIAKFAHGVWNDPPTVGSAFAWMLSTLPGITRSQQTSFFMNGRKPGGIFGNVHRRQAGMPAGEVAYFIRALSYLNRSICNFAVLMMIPGNGNALAQLLMSIINLGLQSVDSALPNWTFLVFFPVSMMLCVANCLGYLAFNTEDGKSVFEWRLLSGHIPHHNELEAYKGLHNLENKIQKARLDKAGDKAIHPLLQTLIDEADGLWHQIKASGNPAQRGQLETKLRAIQAKDLSADHVLRDLLQTALQKILIGFQVSHHEITVVYILLCLQEPENTKTITARQREQVQAVWALINVIAAPDFNAMVERAYRDLNEDEKLDAAKFLKSLEGLSSSSLGAQAGSSALLVGNDPGKQAPDYTQLVP